MKRLWLFVMLCITGMVMMFSCKKKSSLASNVSDATALSSLFGSLHTAPYMLSVQAGNDVIAYCARGTRLHFYPGSFKDAGGHTISSGSVTLAVAEAYNTYDFIGYYLNTGTADGLLGCNGAVNITATMNGQRVYADRYSIGFTQPEGSNKPMQLFYGSVGGDSLVSWGQNYMANSGTAAASTSIDGSGSNFYRYQFDSCTAFNWVCCGHLAGSVTQRTDVKVTIPDATFNTSNTRVFVVLPDDKIIVAASVSAANTFSLPSAAWVSPGASYEVVVLAAKNNVYYYAGATGTITDGIVLRPSLTVTAKENIMSALIALR